MLVDLTIAGRHAEGAHSDRQDGMGRRPRSADGRVPARLQDRVRQRRHRLDAAGPSDRQSGADPDGGRRRFRQGLRGVPAPARRAEPAGAELQPDHPALLPGHQQQLHGREGRVGAVRARPRLYRRHAHPQTRTRLRLRGRVRGVRSGVGEASLDLPVANGRGHDGVRARDRRRHRLRRHRRPRVLRAEHRHRCLALADAPERRCLRSADHLRGEWPAVRGHHGRRSHGADDVLRSADERDALGRHRGRVGVFGVRPGAAAVVSRPLGSGARCPRRAWPLRLPPSSRRLAPGRRHLVLRIGVERRVHERPGGSGRAAVPSGMCDLSRHRRAGRKSAFEVGQRDAAGSLHRRVDHDASEQPGQPVARRLRQPHRLLPPAERISARFKRPACRSGGALAVARPRS